MLIFPVLMNALQYYIIDSFIKGRNSIELESSPSIDEEDDQGQDVDRDGFYRGVRTSQDRLSFIPEEPEEILTKDLEGGESGSETVLVGDGRRVSRKKSSRNVEEYDPAIDGEDGKLGRGADALREEPLLLPIEAESKDAQVAREQRSDGGDKGPKRTRHESR